MLTYNLKMQKYLQIEIPDIKYDYAKVLLKKTIKNSAIKALPLEEYHCENLTTVYLFIVYFQNKYNFAKTTKCWGIFGELLSYLYLAAEENVKSCSKEVVAEAIKYNHLYNSIPTAYLQDKNLPEDSEYNNENYIYICYKRDEIAPNQLNTLLNKYLNIDEYRGYYEGVSDINNLIFVLEISKEIKDTFLKGEFSNLFELNEHYIKYRKNIKLKNTTIYRKPLQVMLKCPILKEAIIDKFYDKKDKKGREYAEQNINELESMPIIENEIFYS